MGRAAQLNNSSVRGPVNATRWVYARASVDVPVDIARRACTNFTMRRHCLQTLHASTMLTGRGACSDAHSGLVYVYGNLLRAPFGRIRLRRLRRTETSVPLDTVNLADAELRLVLPQWRALVHTL